MNNSEINKKPTISKRKFDFIIEHKRQFILSVVLAVIIVTLIVVLIIQNNQKISTPLTTITNSTTTDETSTSTVYALTKELKFKNQTIVINRSQANSTTTASFWTLPTQTIPTSITDIAGVYDSLEWWSSLFYDTKKDKFFELDPSTILSFSIVNEAYITEQSKYTKTEIIDNEEGVDSKIVYSCSLNSSPIQGKSNFKEVSCTSDYYDISTSNEHSTVGTRNNCYIKITGNDRYLAYEIDTYSQGEEIKLCDELNAFGITSVTNK